MPYWKINVNNVHTSCQSGEYFLTYSLWKMQSDAEFRFNAAVLRACKKKKKVQPLGLDSQLMANKDATIHLWVCHCCCCRFWVPFCLPDIYMDGDELCVKTRPKVHRWQEEKRPRLAHYFLAFFIHFFFFEILANKTTMGVRESLPTFAGCIFFSFPPHFALWDKG